MWYEEQMNIWLEIGRVEWEEHEQMISLARDKDEDKEVILCVVITQVIYKYITYTF